MSNMKLDFLSNDGDENEGLSDAGIETFKGTPYSSVARESAQNSRDAMRTMPVRLDFDLIEVHSGDFPDFDEFSAVIDSCMSRALKQNDTKERQFFAKAQKTLTRDTVYGLRISDRGTTGLIGPCEQGRPFHTLVKSSGVSKKNDVTSGGSYGIGKKAAFAVSDLHTVFYSTIYLDDEGKCNFLAQGKCTLVSHERNGSKFRASGYWGSSNAKPVSKEDDAPEWLRRSEVGTTTVSMGFVPSSDWRHKISESLVRNFFVAVHRGELVFGVDEDSISIDATSLPSVLYASEVSRAAEAHGTMDDLEFSRQLYECLISPETKSHTTQIDGLGAFKISVLVKDGMPSRVAFIRNGMIICDSLPRFSDKLMSFRMYKDFVAIVEPEDQAASAILKRLENPQHNELSVDRLIEEAEQASVRRAMNRLSRWVRESIKAEAFVAPSDEVTIEEMNEFFGDLSNLDRIESKDADTNPLAITYTPRKAKPARQNDSGVGEDEEGGAGARGGAKPNGIGGSGAGSGSGRGGHGKGDDLSFEDFRNIPDGGDPSFRRTLHFTPSISGDAEVLVRAKGMSEDVLIKGIRMWDSSGLETRQISLAQGVRTKVTIQFDESYTGPINIQLRKVGGEEQ